MNTKYDKCKKKGYPSRKIAKQCMVTLKSKGRVALQDTYFCDICECWHLTSMNKKQSRNLTKRKTNND